METIPENRDAWDREGPFTFMTFYWLDQEAIICSVIIFNYIKAP